jgi:hypothetical protein
MHAPGDQLPGWGGSAVSSGRAGRLAVVAWLATIAFAVTGLGLVLATWSASVPGVWAFRGFVIPIALSCATVGALVVIRVPANVVGWLLLGAGLLASIQAACTPYAVLGILAAPGSVPGPAVAAWIAGWIWIPAIALVAVFAPLIFPSGRLRSPRWRCVAWLDIGLVVFLVLACAFLPGPLDNSRYVADPFALPIGILTAQTRSMALSPLVVAVALSAFSLALTVRESRGESRQQLKWLALSAALLGAALLAVMISVLLPAAGPASEVAEVLVVAGVIGIPVSAGLAVARYRLWDIDRLISRTVSYGVLTGLLAAVFAGLVVGLQALLAPLTGANTLAVAASTLAVAALFSPLRRRTQRVVDRRFDRSRYDAELTIAALTVRLRDETDLDQVGGEIRTTVRRALAPSSTRIWLRSRGTR